MFGLLCALAPALQATPNFTPDDGVRLSSGVPHDIIEAGGLLRLYFVRDHVRVHSATSTDGLAWSEEPGFRISTQTAQLDQSSITSCALLPLTTGYRMLYSAISSTGGYHILSATSTDGIDWVKEPGVRVEANPATAFVGAVRISSAGAIWRLYFLQDADGGNEITDYELWAAGTTDEGATWSAPERIISAPFGSFDTARLTLGPTRIIYTNLGSGTTVETRLLSRISIDGLNFSAESGVRLSTEPNSVGFTSPVLQKVSDYRWRVYYAFIGGSTNPVVMSALTLFPDPVTVSPQSGTNTNANQAFTLFGEIFSTGTIAIELRRSGETPITATALARPNDMTITGALNISGKMPGYWDVLLTNSDGRSATLSGGFRIDTPGGEIVMTDNLFKPAEGGRAKIEVKTFDPGSVSLKIYTINGALVKELFEGEQPIGTSTYFWGGDTQDGRPVASGLYYLHAKGPKLNKIEKIIVIK
ncbi:MAG: hypothetical protein HYT79_10855 [Elusimicrobia bacterium]|nr:hypothetical protein [Elusimicrobiota bacterium]